MMSMMMLMMRGEDVIFTLESVRVLVDACSHLFHQVSPSHRNSFIHTIVIEMQKAI